MIDVDIEISKSDIKSIRQRLGQFEGKAPDVLSRAINRTVSSVKTEIKREASRKYTITQQAIGKTLKDRKASPKDLKGYVKSIGSVIPLIKFRVSPQRTVMYDDDGKPNPSHYSAAVFKGQGLKPLDRNPKAFAAIMPNKKGDDHGGVFERTGRKSRKNPKREAIAERFGPSVPHMINNKYVIDRIKNKADDTMMKRIDAEINYILSRG